MWQHCYILYCTSLQNLDHLQVFFTKYKGVVLRNGSPLRNNFDRILLRLYNAGIIDKITQVWHPNQCWCC